MWKDPIVEEVRKVRDSYARKFNYDIGAICDNLRREERASRRKFISHPPRRVEPANTV